MSRYKVVNLNNLQRSIAFGLAIFFLAILGLPASVAAQTVDQQITQNDINDSRFWPFYDSNSATSACSATTTSTSVPAGTLPSFIPEPYNGAFTQGANSNNVAPSLVAAIFSEEHDLGGDEMNPNVGSVPAAWALFVKQQGDPDSGWATNPDSGAAGPFQFLPSTWTGLGYNISDINNLAIASNAAAKYLASNGGTIGSPTQPVGSPSLANAIYDYNHADWYVNATLQYYDYYNGQPGATSSGGSTTISETSNPCNSSNGVVAGSIVQTALGLSWPDTGHGTTPTPAYVAAMQQYNPSGYSATGGLGDDCGVFVATVMHASGADPNYPDSGTNAQAAYVLANPDKYTVIFPATSTAQLEPGDILILNGQTTETANGTIIPGDGSGTNGHTFIYLGSDGTNGNNEASASLGDRSANQGVAQLTDGRGQYMIARFK
jgi:hypothetical protein